MTSHQCLGIGKLITQSQIKEILTSPLNYPWTIQGFGMLRLWIDPDGTERLHIWDTETANEDVSTLHTHPWDFDSVIISGKLINQRYNVEYYGNSTPPDHHFKASTIKTGEGGYLSGTPFNIRAIKRQPEYYSTEDNYHQDAEEYHESYPEKGCVTLIRRNFRFNRFATVGWAHGTNWVTAEPRAATPEEIIRFTSLVNLNFR